MAFDIKSLLQKIDEVIAALKGGITVTSSENLAKVNNITVDVGNGSSGNGTQRVAIATLDNVETKANLAAITDNTAKDLFAADATLHHYITSLLVTNSHATVGTLVSIQDEDAVILWQGYAAPVSGGFFCKFERGELRSPTANKKLQVICGTTGSNVYVSVAGYKAA